ncbi:hypothetical protein Leryth_008328 [Lithospermum erythrorhizon]|nr:hypothetical protein Leryth_008328 [Lithospermum erythrorhizon]
MPLCRTLSDTCIQHMASDMSVSILFPNLDVVKSSIASNVVAHALSSPASHMSIVFLISFASGEVGCDNKRLIATVRFFEVEASRSSTF